MDGRAEYEARLVELHAKGMRGRMARVFAQYTAQFSEPDPAFDTLYLDGLFATGTPPRPLRRRERFRRLIRELERTLALTGRVAECGCAAGLSSYLLCSRLRQHDREFDGSAYEIYDSFEGLSEPQAEDALEPGAEELVAQSRHAGKFAVPLEQVQRALVAFPRIRYGRGWIPSAFPEDEGRYRFVHVDVDLYQPTRASLEYFWPRLVPGGIIVCDDYNWGGAKRAVNEFAAAAATRFTVTPNTQAVFSKPAHTAE
jgi:O-methyltransferase